MVNCGCNYIDMTANYIDIMLSNRNYIDIM